MKAARVLLFVYCALLIIAIGCGGNSTTSQTGTPPNSGGSGSGGGNGGGSPSEFIFTIENPNAASSVESFGIGSNGSMTHISSTNARFNAAEIVTDSKFVFF